MRYGFLGGKSFNPVVVAEYLGGLPAGATVVVGDGQGLERYVREQAPELGLTVLVPPLRPDLYTKPRDRQVNDVFIKSLGWTLVLGKGTRADIARDILKRSKTWPITVVELDP